MTFINWEDLPFEEDLTISGFTTIKSRIKHYNDQNHTRRLSENRLIGTFSRKNFEIILKDTRLQIISQLKHCDNGTGKISENNKI